MCSISIRSASGDERHLDIMDLTNRQWRALAQAYPYFFFPTCEEAEASATVDAHADVSPKRAEFEQYVVPRARRAFQTEVDELVGAQACDEPAQPLVEAVEALFAHLFNRPSVFSSGSTSVKPVCKASPLSAREVQLLGLYHRKQQQYEYIYSTQQQLLESSQAALRTLQSALHTVATADAATVGDVNGDTHGGSGLVDSTRESLMWLSGGSAVAAATLRPSHAHPFNAKAAQATDATRATTAAALATAAAADVASASFTSALAGLPYTAPTLANADVHLPSCGAFPPSLTAANRCAGCGEVGGDLLVCTQCGEIRHEACGGPHPLERSRMDGSLPSVNVCRRCAKELNLSSSSSSLRSSTSSSERAELEEYFDSEEDSESSLSGFVVHSSDEEDDEEGEEEEENSSEGSPSRSRDHDHRGGSSKKDGSRAVSRRHNSRLPSVEKRRKYSHRHRHRSGSDRSSSHEEEEVRRRFNPPNKRRRGELEEKHASTASSIEEKALFMTASSASSSSSSSSSLTAPPPIKQSQQQLRSAAPIPSHAAARKSTECDGRLKKQAKPTESSTPPSAQAKRHIQDEQDELAILGITEKATPAEKTKLKMCNAAASSLQSASPAQRQRAPELGEKNGKAGGRSRVVNIASSSSTSDSDND